MATVNKNQTVQTAKYTVLFFGLLSLVIFYFVKRPGIDFLQYVGAIKAFGLSANPYDPKTAFDIQKTLIPTITQAIMFWAPPWMAVLLLPVEIFHEVHQQWNIFLILVALYASTQFYAAYRLTQSFLISTVSVCTLSLVAMVSIGNAGFIDATGMSLLLVGLLQSVSSFVVIGLLLLSTKPHIASVFLVITFALIPQKTWSSIKQTILPALCLVIVTSLIFGFDSLLHWKESFNMTEGDLYAVPRAAWRCANFDGVLMGFGSIPAALRFSITAALNILLIGLIFINRGRLQWKVDFLWILPLTLFIAPYGWLYDGMILQLPIAYGLLLCRNFLSVTHYQKIIIGYIAFQIISLLFFIYGAEFQHQFWWYAPMHCLFGVYVALRSRTDSNYSAISPS